MMTLHQIVCADPSIAASLKPLAHHRNIASLSFFYCYYLVDVYLNWLNCFHFLILVLSSTRYCNGLHNFSVTFPR